MSGSCPDCGNTLCICSGVIAQLEEQLSIATVALQKILDNALGYKPSACDISELAEEALNKIKGESK